MITRKKQRDILLTKNDLQNFEDSVAAKYDKALIHAPVHLSWGNEETLIDIFQYIHESDWVLSTWRNHYHALLHGVPKEVLMEEIEKGHSCSFQSPKNNFYTSAIVTGIIPISVGIATSLKWKNSPQMVWCFVGDMTAESGTFYEAVKYSIHNELPIHFIIEDNKLSTNTPTVDAWGLHNQDVLTFGKTADDIIDKYVTRYHYERSKYPHVCTRSWVQF